MEADWEFEIGGEAEVIDAAWAGFVDLRRAPERAGELEEVVAFPPLGQALVRLNSPASPVWTAKCDFWPELEAGAWDADEMDADPLQAAHGAGCYIDLLPRSHSQWSAPILAERACRALCQQLNAAPLPGCRVDLIVRRAWITPEQQATGVTAYLTACAGTKAAASRQLEACLDRFVQVLCADAPAIPQTGNSTIQ